MRNLQTFKETFFSSCDAFYRKVISKRKTVLHAVIVVFALFFAPLPVSEALASDSVSSSGAFMLPIPIVTPPGRAGIQPALTLTYNSQGLNGWVGAGWSLGVGDIHRRLKNGVKYEAGAGEYEVNNTKLIRVREWDIDGHHAYAPETQTDFTKYFIKLHNNKESETLGWVVHTKDGKILEYGTTADSKQAFKSKTRFANNSYYHVFKWCLNKVTDANGNYMEISYYKHRISYSDDDDMEYGVQVYLKEIDYTGNENGTGTTNKVIFHLEDRTDHNSNYLTNYEVRTEKRLKSIEVRNNDSMVRAYALEYDESDHTSRSRLKSVTQYGDDATINADGEVSGTSLPPHRFEYEGFNVDKSHFEQATASKSGGIDYYGRRDGWVNWTVTGDFNGDGNTDLVATKYVEGGRKKTTFLMYDHSTQTFDEPTNNQWDLLDTLRFQLGSEQSYLISNDFDRDGRDDLFVYSQALDDGNLKPIYYNLYFSRTYDGVQTFSLASSNHCSKISEWHFKVSLGDFNGDGLSDLLYSGRGPKKGRYMMALYDESTKCFNKVHEGYYSEDGNENNNIYDELIPKIGDFNGDGKSDVLLVDARFHGIDKSGYRLFISNGSSLVYKSERVLTETAENKFFEQPKGIGDFNGDGKADLFFHYKAGNYNKLLVYHSDGENLNPAFDSKSDAGNLPTDEADMYIGDFNGDNRNDIMAVYKNNTGCDFYLLENNKPVKIERDKIQECTQMYNFALADYNGDGATDFMTLRSLGVTNDKNPLLWSLYHSQEDSETISGNFDLLTKHTNSLGGITSVNYQPSSDQDMTNGTMSDLHKLPFVLYLVRSVTLDDRVNNTGDDTATFTYSYNEGKYDFPTREFRGFYNVVKTDPLGIKTIKYFYQDKERKGILKNTRKYLSSNDDDGYFQSSQYWKVNNSSIANTFLYLDHTYSYFSHLNGERNSNNKKYVYYSYDDYGNTLSVIKSNIYSRTTGIKTEFVYENKNPDMWIWRKTSEIIKENQAENFAKKTTFTYDIMGNLTRKRSYINSFQYIGEYFKYNTFGNMTSSDVKDDIHNTYVFVYDSTQTYLFKKKFPTVGSTTLSVSYTYNTSYGQIATEKDVNGNQTEYEYDKFGRQKKVKYPDGGQIEKTYHIYTNNPFSPSVVRTGEKNKNGDWSWTKEFFDGMSRVVQTLSSHLNNQAVAILSEYDALGRKKAVFGPTIVSELNSMASFSSPYIRTTYDGLSRAKSLTIPDSDNSGEAAETTTSYDGYVTTITGPDNANKSQKKVTKNYLDRIVQVEEKKSNSTNNPWITTTYEYDTVGNLVKITDDNGNETTMKYDMLGRKTKITDPDTGKTGFAYDANGNLTYQTDNAGNVIIFTYDELNRVTLKAHSSRDKSKPNGYKYESISNDYDVRNYCSSNCLGRPVSVSRSNSSGTISKTDYEAYDEMGRAIKVSQTHFDIQRTTEYTYDEGGRLTEIIYPYPHSTIESNKTKVTYEYHERTKLIKNVSSGGTIYGQIPDYTADGNIIEITFGNDLKTDYTYYPNSRHLKKIDTIKGNKNIMNLEYTYTTRGNIATKSIDKQNEAEHTYNYTYDPLGRLTSAKVGTDSLTSYIYDDIGNITSRTVGDDTYAYTYDANRPHAVKNVRVDGKNYPYDYDDNGNLISGPDLGLLSDGTRDGTRTFKYNKDNMPAKIVYMKPDDNCSIDPHLIQHIKLYYDGAGNRIVKKVWDNHNHVGRIDYFGKILQEYTLKTSRNYSISHIFVGDLRIASVKKNIGLNTIKDTRYFHKDHLGSTGVTTDKDGNETNEAEYLPYGYQDDASSSTDYLFTDQELDSEVGLYNYKARMYDPMIGRFTTADSIVPDLYNSQSLNRYSYCLNNPIKYKDPSGHRWKMTERNVTILRGATAIFMAGLVLGSMPAIIATAATLTTYAGIKAVGSAWVARQTVASVARKFAIGVGAIMYSKSVVPYVKAKYDLNSYETEVFDSVTFMVAFWGTRGFGGRAAQGSRTAYQIVADSMEGYTRASLNDNWNSYFTEPGDKGTFGYHVGKNAIRVATAVKGVSKYVGIWASEFAYSLNSAFRTDLKGFSDSKSKGIDYIRITKDFSEYTEPSTFMTGRELYESWNSSGWDYSGGNYKAGDDTLQTNPSCSISDDFSEDSARWTYIGYNEHAYWDIDNEYAVLTLEDGNKNRLFWISGEAGVMWFDQEIKYTKMLVDFRFKAYKKGNGSKRGEGFVMMFYKNKDYAPRYGNYLGFEDIRPETSGTTQTNFDGYGIEFDYYDRYGNPGYRHIAVIKDRIRNHLARVNFSEIDDNDFGEIGDNEWHSVRVVILDKLIKVYVDDLSSPVLTWEGGADFIPIFGGFGFAASTSVLSSFNDNEVSQSHIIDDVQIMVPNLHTQYTVSASASPGGSIAPSEHQNVKFGEKTTFTLNPDAGYFILSVDGTCGGTLEDKTFTTEHVTGDCTVDVKFNPFGDYSVVLYRDRNFDGDDSYFNLGFDKSSIKVNKLSSETVGNNSTSSIWIGNSVEVYLYDTYDFGGRFVRLTSNDADLGDFDNKASSMIIIRRVGDYEVRLYKDKYFSGGNKTFLHTKTNRDNRESTRTPKLYYAGFAPNDTLSSIVIGSKVEVYLFSDTNYNGWPFRLKMSNKDMSINNMDNKASSMFIKNKMNRYKVRLYKHINFMGFQRTLGDGKKGDSPRRIASVEHIGVDHDIISSMDIGDNITVCVFGGSWYNSWTIGSSAYRFISSEHNFNLVHRPNWGTNFNDVLSSLIIHYEKDARCLYGAYDPDPNR